MSAFCSICTSARGPFHKEPIGKNDALVDVCSECATVVPREYHPKVERGYEPQGSTLDLYQAVAAAARRVLPARERRLNSGRRLEHVRRLTPGWVLVRVGKRGHGSKPRDRHEAEKLLLKEPWGRHVRYLGNDARFHLFERPDAEAAAKLRMSDENPLAELAALEQES